jgi:hypothetical protein
MGGGFYSNGRFNLVVSLRYAPNTGELAFLCQLFNEVSKILYDLTDGRHSIGQVLFSTNSMGGADADIWIHPNDDVWPNSTGARLWFPTESLDVSQDYMMYATVQAHELCHYLYDLRDEYNNGSSCQNNINTQASMMEGYDWINYTRWSDTNGHDYATWAAFWADFTAGKTVFHIGEPSEFCHAGNHNANANNNQNNLNNKQSCWTYIANDANHNNIPYGLTAPGVAGPTLAQPTPAPANSTCTELIPVQRFLLVLDRSGSMTGAKIEQLKVGANFWVDYVNPNEELGMVTYSTSSTLDTHMSEAPADPATAANWRNSRHTTVNSLSAGGVTAIGDALRMGLNDIIAGGRASSQVMILFTDGLQNYGTETAEQVLPDLISAGVRVYTIGLGNDQDASLLANIASTTGATYFPISGDLDSTSAANAISEALIQLSGESRENGGIVSFHEVDPTAPDQIGANEPFQWALERTSKTASKEPVTSFRFPVEITSGSSHCTLGALWKYKGEYPGTTVTNVKPLFQIKVFDPTGTLVVEGPGVRYVRDKYQYSFYEIDKPKAGKWQVEVSGRNISQARFRTIGFEVNNNIRLEVAAVKTHIKQGSELQLRARVFAPHAVPGAKLIAWVYSPIGTWSKIKFVEHTGKKGDTAEAYSYSAIVKTGSVFGNVKRGQYLIAVDASLARGSFEFKLDEFYRRKPGLSASDMTRSVKVPSLKRRKFLAVVADAEGPSKKEPIPGYNSKDPFVPKNQKILLSRWKKAHGMGT